MGICQFIGIDPPGIPQNVLNSDAEPAVEKKHNSNALTAMRERSAQDAHLRIVWGGRVTRASGWMAGILEEVACTLKLKKPLLVLGGFGGCARVIADFLNDPSASWPSQLNLAESADADRDALLTDSEREQLIARMIAIQKLVTQFRTAIHSEKSVNGLSSSVIRSALLEENSRSVISRAADAAKQAGAV